MSKEKKTPLRLHITAAPGGGEVSLQDLDSEGQWRMRFTPAQARATAQALNEAADLAELPWAAGRVHKHHE